MTNVIQFGSRKKAEPKLEGRAPVHMDGDINVSLNKALLSVQYCALVLGDQEMARDLLLAVAECPLGNHPMRLPGKFHEVIATTDTEATYKAILGVL